jgi:hypothetical protein
MQSNRSGRRSRFDIFWRTFFSPLSRGLFASQQDHRFYGRHFQCFLSLVPYCHHDGTGADTAQKEAKANTFSPLSAEGAAAELTEAHCKLCLAPHVHILGTASFAKACKLRWFNLVTDLSLPATIACAGEKFATLKLRRVKIDWRLSAACWLMSTVVVFRPFIE